MSILYIVHPCPYSFIQPLAEKGVIMNKFMKASTIVCLFATLLYAQIDRNIAIKKGALEEGRQWTEGERGWAEDGTNLWTGVSPLPLYNVGIGTSAPSYKLHVNGSFRANGININGVYSFPTADGTSGYVLKTNGAGVVSWQQDNAGTGTVTGSGTADYLSKWTSATNLGNSQLYDNGTNVGIGTNSPSNKLHIVGGGDLTLFDNTGGYRAIHAIGGQTGVSSYVIDGEFTGNRGSAVRGYIDAFTKAYLGYIDATTGDRCGLYAKGEDYAVYTVGKVHMEGSVDYFMDVENTGSGGCIKAVCDCGWSEGILGWNTNSGNGAYGVKAISNGHTALWANNYVEAEGYDVHDKTRDGKKVKLTAIVSPKEEYYSSGTGKLVNGETRIEFHDVFKGVISTKSEARIILTPTANCEGLYIVFQDKDGFVVKELRDGNSNASFNWLAIGERSD